MFLKLVKINDLWFNMLKKLGKLTFKHVYKYYPTFEKVGFILKNCSMIGNRQNSGLIF
jgi:hypothetical protein